MGNGTQLRHLLDCDPVVITGMGTLAASAPNPAALWRLMLTAQSPAVWWPDPIPGIDRPVPVCRIGRLDTTALSRATRKMDRSVQLAWLAAKQAAGSANLPSTPYASTRCGVIAGTSRGPVTKSVEALSRMGKRRMLPTLAAMTPVAGVSGGLAQDFGFTGPSYTVSATCSSGAHALMAGAEELLLGNLDCAVAGGVDAPLEASTLAQLAASRLLGSAKAPGEACRPFDRTRNGMLIGEGAAFFVLELESRAIRRGARIHGRLQGWAKGLDPTGRTGMDEHGEALLPILEQALDTADLTPAEIGYVNTHGTGTQVNDRAESRALARLFQGRDHCPPCSSTKPLTGHCLGASPALETAILLMALEHQVLPPTLNCAAPDDDSPTDLVRGEPRPANLTSALSIACGFWGHQSALILSRAR